MSMAFWYSKNKYYSQFNSDELLREVQKNISSSVDEIQKEYQYIFYKMIHMQPCSYWDKEIFKETLFLLEELQKEKEDDLEITEDTYNWFLMGYNSYNQISKIISDLKNFNVSQELKNQIYRFPTYTGLLEGSLSNFLRVIVTIIGLGIGKDYTKQTTLGQLLNVIKANGYNKIIDKVDINVRNAINHGKVISKKTPADTLCFYYMENHISQMKEMLVYEFDDMIDATYDVVSAVLLALCVFMNNHMELMKLDSNQKGYVQFEYLSMQLSLPGIVCQNINDTGNQKQINVEIEIDNTERQYLGMIATLLAILVFNKFDDYEQYMIAFQNPRMQYSWIRYTNREINDMITQTRSFGEVLQEVINRSDFILFDPSTEKVDLNEVKYFCFPNYTSQNLMIRNVQDASTANKKRLRAMLFIGEKKEKKEIIEAIEEAINWLKTVKNPPSPTMPQKHGEMPADSLYINVYRKDERKRKELLPGNENFVCFVDYNENGETTLEHGGIFESIWKKFYHEQIGKMRIAWRESKYFQRNTNKIGRNDPCPCGSGLKYKRCCGKK